jgi:hypothetical protein
MTRLLSLDEAACRLGTTSDEIQQWIHEGLLPVFVGDRFSTHTSGSLPPEAKVDEEKLWEVAETMGWLKLSVEAWDETCAAT